MSVQSTLRRSIWSASQRAPTTPPIGPETSVVASWSASIEIVPPCEAMTRSSKPGARRLRAIANGTQRAARGLCGVALDDGRVQPREVAARGVQLGGDEQRHVAVERTGGLLLLEDLLHARLVGRVAVGEQQRDADALDAGVEQRGGRLAHVRLTQRQRLVAEQVDTPADAEDAVARHQRRVVVVGRDVQPVGVGVAEVGLDAALHLQRVLLAGGHDHADVEALRAKQPVEHRGAAEDARPDAREDVLLHQVPLAQRVVGGAHQAVALVLRRRLCLSDDEPAGLVDDERVGHRPAGVDRQHPRRVAVCRHPQTLSSDPALRTLSNVVQDRVLGQRLLRPRPQANFVGRPQDRGALG